jgi:signal transduction histidine kinase
MRGPFAGIATRIALVAIVGLIGAQLLSVGVALLMRPPDVRVYAVAWLVERSADIARGTFARPAEARRAYLRARPEAEHLALDWARDWQPSDEALRRPRQGVRLARAIADRLPDGFVVAVEFHRPGAGPGPRLPRFGEGQVVRVPREEGGGGEGAFEGVLPALFAIAIRGPDGSHVLLRPQLPAHGWPLTVLLAWLAGIAAAAAAAAWWAARRVARPLEVLAANAARAGAGLSPVFAAPEAAPREVGAIAAALDGMHARLRGVVEDRTRMLAAISHDLRTPLTRLRLRAEQIADPEERARAAADIDEMERMIAETLSFARADALETRAERFDLAALVHSLVDDRADLGADIALEGPASLTIEGRPGALRRALDNLAANALAHGGRARLTIAPGPSRILVHVDDDGPGLPPHELERVFAPFYRLEASRSRDTGGVGLGLAVARDIARAHGGDIVLANRSGGGLRATLSLPA